MAESSGRGHAVAGNVSRSPSTDNRSPKIAGDNGSTYEECKSPTHFMKEWQPSCEEELKPTQGLQFANLEELELQRHGQLQSDNETLSSKPQLKTPKDLERHVSEIYTHANFYKFQGEFWIACMDCEVDEKKVIDEEHVISIVDNSQNRGVKRQVVYNASNHVAHCLCKKFECEGISCRHILCVLKGKGLSELLSLYILHRWTKMASSKPIFIVNSTLLEGRSQMMHKDKLISNNWVEFLECMRLAGSDPDKLTLLGKRIQNIVKELKELDGGTSDSKISSVSLVEEELP